MKVRAVADGLHELLEDSGYCGSWLHESGRILDVICRLHRDAGLESYDQGVVEAFAEDAMRRHDKGVIVSSAKK